MLSINTQDAIYSPENTTVEFENKTIESTMNTTINGLYSKSLKE